VRLQLHWLQGDNNFSAFNFLGKVIFACEPVFGFFSTNKFLLVDHFFNFFTKMIMELGLTNLSNLLNLLGF